MKELRKMSELSIRNCEQYGIDGGETSKDRWVITCDTHATISPSFQRKKDAEAHLSRSASPEQLAWWCEECKSQSNVTYGVVTRTEIQYLEIEGELVRLHERTSSIYEPD
jgi:hypothetical protein